MVERMGALNIKNDEAHRLAAEIAAQTGDSLTGAVLTALREKRAALAASQGPDPALAERLIEMGRQFRAELEARGIRVPSSADDDDLYDEIGLPR
jgi:antitoxin VapB